MELKVYPIYGDALDFEQYEVCYNLSQYGNYVIQRLSELANNLDGNATGSVAIIHIKRKVPATFRVSHAFLNDIKSVCTINEISMAVEDTIGNKPVKINEDESEYTNELEVTDVYLGFQFKADAMLFKLKDLL